VIVILIGEWRFELGHCSGSFERPGELALLLCLVSVTRSATSRRAGPGANLRTTQLGVPECERRSRTVSCYAERTLRM
jgi:hypothetical protein